jgi:membrane-bound metal-dependent hydrolase YbcI (DUF457 family)
VDIFTHALASVAVARITIPRAPLAAWVAAVVAGTVADVDELSAVLGPASYLTWHYTYTHSLGVTLIAALALTALCYPLVRSTSSPRATSLPAILLTLLSVGFLHLALDVCGSDGVALFWPFLARRIAADWLAHIDPWLIVILLAAILLPELLHLVSHEIGSKEKRPRGRVGATIGVILAVLYVGARATFHSNALAAIQARTYRGESPRHSAVFPESASLFTWHGIVETDRAVHELTVNSAFGSSFDPETIGILFKPEPSQMLEPARISAAGKKFLNVARFPKASVEKTPEGYDVQLRDLRYAVAGNTPREIAAVIKTDSGGKLLDDTLVWARDLHRK